MALSVRFGFEGRGRGFDGVFMIVGMDFIKETCISKDNDCARLVVELPELR
jgi:hypothetical protein